MKNTMNYKGYAGKIEYDNDEKKFFGTIVGINDLVMFEGESVDELNASFKEAVDDYLETCKKLGKSPEKEFRGQFNVRIPAELHKKIYIKAISKEESLNAAVTEAIESYVAKDS